MKVKKIFALVIALVVLASFATALAETPMPVSFIIEVDGVFVEFPATLLADEAAGGEFAKWVMKAKQDGKVFVKTETGGVRTIAIDFSEGTSLLDQIADPTKVDETENLTDVYKVESAAGGNLIVTDGEGGMHTIDEDGNVTEISQVDADLAAAKAAANALTEEDYTAASWADLQDALALPEDDDEAKTAKIAAINEAIEALVDAGEEPDVPAITAVALKSATTVEVTIVPATKGLLDADFAVAIGEVEVTEFTVTEDETGAVYTIELTEALVEGDKVTVSAASENVEGTATSQEWTTPKAVYTVEQYRDATGVQITLLKDGVAVNEADTYSVVAWASAPKRWNPVKIAADGTAKVNTAFDNNNGSKFLIILNGTITDPKVENIEDIEGVEILFEGTFNA